MRIPVIILLSAAVGSAFGVGLAYYEVGKSLQAAPLADQDDRPELVKSANGQPRVEVDQVDYDFGRMQRGTKKSHEFIFRNVGESPLELEVGPSTCKCTVGNVPKKAIAPGESEVVSVEWSAHVDGGLFRQSAVIFTNDPLTPRVELHIQGTVTDVSGLVPTSLFFDKIYKNEPKSAEVVLMAFLEENLEVSNAEIGNPALRPYFDLSVEPLSQDQLPNSEAKSGVKIRLTAKPGIVPGRFTSWVRLNTNLPEARELEIPIEGQVIGDVSIRGRGWDEYQAILQLGSVRSSEGISRTVNVIVRGEMADTAEFEVVSSEPKELVAMLGTPRRLKKGLLHVPLTVEVPPGTRSMARLAIPQSEPGQIVLKTNLADQPELIVRVGFTVER